MKKIVVALCGIAVCFSPLFAQADPCSPEHQSLNGGQDLQMNGNQGMGNLSGTDYHYEAWIEGGNSSDQQLKWYGANKGGGAAFYAKWKNPNDYLARIGYYWGGNGGPAFSTLKNVYMDFNYTRSGNNTAGDYSYIGTYGWARNPNASNSDEKLIEFYIVEDWFGNPYQNESTPVGPGTIMSDLPEDQKKHFDTITVDGSTYKLYKKTRTGSSVDGNSTFTQIFSVRDNQRKCGTISVNEHVKAWEELGGLIFKNMYDLKFLAEAGGGEGWFDAKYLKITQENDPRGVPEGSFVVAANASPSNGGSVTRSPALLYYESGASVELTAIPTEGWKFDGWEGDASGTDTVITITVNEKKNITAKFSLRPDNNIELVKDGDFPGTSLNSSNWSLNIGEHYGNSQASANVSGGKVEISISNANNNSWEPQLTQYGIELINGMDYILTYTAQASAERNIEVSIQKAVDPWNDYARDTVSLTTEAKLCTLTFKMTEPTDLASQLSFNLGGKQGSQPSVTISDVSLKYVVDVSPIKPVSPPRPKVKFSISSLSDKSLLVKTDSPVVVEIYDLKGKEITSFSARGSQTVNLSFLPSGVYFAKLRGVSAQSVMFVLKLK